MSAAGYGWGAVNVADGHGLADWQVTISQLNASGMRVPVWGRVQNMPLEELMGVAIASRRPVILNIEDEFKTTSPAVFERRIKDMAIPFYTWTRKNVPYQITQMLARPGR